MSSTVDLVFPIFENPSSAFGLLLGQDVTLVTYQLPSLNFGFEWSQFFPIIGPLGARIGARIGAQTDLGFGFDTRGLREFYESDFQGSVADLIFDGFFILDTDKPDGSGTDIPFFKITGGIEAAAELNLLIAQAGVKGGLEIGLGLDFWDPDGNGKIYFDEIARVIDEFGFFQDL